MSYSLSFLAGRKIVREMNVREVRDYESWMSNVGLLLKNIESQEFCNGFCKAGGLSTLLYYIKILPSKARFGKVIVIQLFYLICESLDISFDITKVCAIDEDLIRCVLECIHFFPCSFTQNLGMRMISSIIKDYEKYLLVDKAERILSKDKKEEIPYKFFVSCLNVHVVTLDGVVVDEVGSLAFQSFLVLDKIMMSCVTIPELFSFVSCLVKNEIFQTQLFMQFNFEDYDLNLMEKNMVRRFVDKVRIINIVQSYTCAGVGKF